MSDVTDKPRRHAIRVADLPRDVGSKSGKLALAEQVITDHLGPGWTWDLVADHRGWTATASGPDGRHITVRRRTASGALLGLAKALARGAAPKLVRKPVMVKPRTSWTGRFTWLPIDADEFVALVCEDATTVVVQQRRMQRFLEFNRLLEQTPEPLVRELVRRNLWPPTR